ncbi:protein STICHEL-like [Dorcoceras hygrometricum]|uniref:Protein STICHEL-like n=1 Tax=Dorcoceras hygrometricum TaxID=472368 RepID=A0A2Z7BJU2_9LAMI|nr:protein STICHEL-like [Dorcoceras hygrometricum]
MVKSLATSPHDPLGITDSACKNQSVMASVRYGPFNSNIPIRSTTIGKSRFARDPITMHISWRSNSDIACVTRTSEIKANNSAGKSEEPQHHAQPISRWKSSIRDIQERHTVDHHSSVVFRRDNLADHHLDEIIGPFRRDN